MYKVVKAIECEKCGHLMAIKKRRNHKKEENYDRSEAMKRYWSNKKRKGG